MIRSHSIMLACLALSVACASKNSEGSDNPDSGQYDGATDGATTPADDAATTPAGPRPKARASTGTRSGTRKMGKARTLVATKPPVSTPDKPAPTRNLTAEFAVDGVFPTSAPVGSTIEIYGSGFPEDAAEVKVFVGGKRFEIIEATPGRILATVGAATSGVVEVGKGTGRINRKGRAKTNNTFTATAADAAFGQPREKVGHGLAGTVYAIEGEPTEVPDFNSLGAPIALIGVDDLDIAAGDLSAGVAGRGQSFGIHFQGSLNIVEEGEYELCLNSGDGALLFLDQTPVIDNDGAGETREVCEVLFVEPGEYAVDLLYYQGADTEGGLTFSWAKDGGAREAVPAEALFPPDALYDMAVAVNQ